MSIHARAYQPAADDFERVRMFLRETHRLNRTRHNWELRRWDRWRYERDDLDTFPTELIRIWEQEDREIVAVAHPESEGDVFVQIHPEHRGLEPEIFSWAEVALATAAPTGQRTLETWVYEYDEVREMLLAQMRYRRQREHRHHRWRSLRTLVQAPYLPQGYKLRTVEHSQEDVHALADLLSICLEEPLTGAALHNFHLSPGYHTDLDIVVVEEDTDLIVAHCSATMDEVNQVAEISPPCTHPDHRLQGLARAVMFEVMRRLRHNGIQRTYVSCGDDRTTNKLYEKVGFRDFHREYRWFKQF